ncbi:MAG: hypothetical protein C4562_00940 [Actinobacteria bacterium]|nr:MAG: hypothetical protein C4562_00940 [Actinomycetota bacterium]
MQPHDNLLKLQEIDTIIDSKRHKKNNLEAQKELEKVQSDIAKLDSLEAKSNDTYKQRKQSQDRIESQITMLEQKMKKEQDRLYSGKVSNPKELGSIQEELKHFEKNKDGIENDLLEVMESVQEIEDMLNKIKARKEDLSKKSNELEGKVVEQTAAYDKEIEELLPKRDTQASKIDKSLLAQYDSLREELGGVAVAALIDGLCQGCHVQLPAQEADRIASSKELNKCPNCERILVP